jgi:Xaa-Pro aminopeptidase
MRKLLTLVVIVVISALALTELSTLVVAQDVPVFTQDFPPEEFLQRRASVYDAIGSDGVALVQGAPSPAGYVRFRQSNVFYYLCGVETPHSYLLMDGATRSSHLYLPKHDARRAASEGGLLTANDPTLAAEMTGVEEVHDVGALAAHLERYAAAEAPPTLFVPFAPAEGASGTRGMSTRTIADIADDPWDGRLSRGQQMVALIREAHPGLAIEDLSPTLDRLRLVKSPREIAMIRRATQLSGQAIIEAMRSTEPGLMEYEIDGLARFVYYRNGAQGEAYYSLVASGPNAWWAHYHAGQRRMRDGELVLMDFGPDVGYYSADVTRQWPVNGRFNDWQRDLYGFYLGYYNAILHNIRPGDVQAIKRDALGEMEALLSTWEFTQPHYRAAAEQFIERYRASADRPGGSLGHGVGMAVHDVGNSDGVLTSGMVFTIEPQFRVPEDQIYIRLEDMILITDEGAEILSDFVPITMSDVEATIAEEGLLQQYPGLPWKKK